MIIMNSEQYYQKYFSKGVFITGTDTGVGKTVISALILRALINIGVKPSVIKPIETGCIKKDSNLIPSDGIFLKDMAEMDDPIDIIVPIKYELPLSPLVASRIENKPISFQRIDHSFELLINKYDFLIAEGAGGILVPVAISNNALQKKTIYIADIVKRFNLPLIVVSRATLGTINHTLLTVNYAMSIGINIVGIIINYSKSSDTDISEKTNPQIIHELSPVPVLGVVPYIHKIDKENLDKLTKNECKEMLKNLFERL
ncbi:MAG: dethiobiotin synthase [Thermodesulfovibrionales bacterium]|nr:dethiobiotin synthase [Thermodesulfovibrionales bacterium]